MSAGPHVVQRRRRQWRRGVDQRRFLQKAGDPARERAPGVRRGCEACVDRELEVGKSTGIWVPGLNDCHTVVNDILDKCRNDTLEKALQDDTARKLREADAGAP
jgi:hypothetical protein